MPMDWIWEVQVVSPTCTSCKLDPFSHSGNPLTSMNMGPLHPHSTHFAVPMQHDAGEGHELFLLCKIADNVPSRVSGRRPSGDLPLQTNLGCLVRRCTATSRKQHLQLEFAALQIAFPSQERA